MKSYLSSNNQLNTYYPFLKELLSKASALLRLYIRVPRSDKSQVDFFAYQNTFCKDMIARAIKFETHLLMIGSVFEHQ